METVDKNSKESSTADNLKAYRGARVLWPPECPDDMLDVVISEARRLLDENDVDSDGAVIVESLKKFMDQRFEPYWHVVCGRHFGCYAIHQSRRFIYFYLDNIAFLLYKGS